MKYLAKYLYSKFWPLLRHSPISKRIYHKSAVRILLYHNIPSKMLNRFRDHMIFIKQHWGFLNPKDWDYFLSGENKFHGIRVLVTFDDGFKSQLYATREVLDPLGIKAIFFIPVNFIGLKNVSEVKQFVTGNLRLKNLSKELFPMDWDNLDRLAKNGHVIGSHTLNHPLLSKITDTNVLRSEIWESGNIIEQKLGIQVRWFAYPYGRNKSINFKVYTISKMRYTYLAINIGGLNKADMNRQYVFRDSVKAETPLDIIKLTLEGGLDFINYRRFYYFKMALKKNKAYQNEHERNTY